MSWMIEIWDSRSIQELDDMNGFLAVITSYVFVCVYLPNWLITFAFIRVYFEMILTTFHNFKPFHSFISLNFQFPFYLLTACLNSPNTFQKEFYSCLPNDEFNSPEYQFYLWGVRFTWIVFLWVVIFIVTLIVVIVVDSF